MIKLLINNSYSRLYGLTPTQFKEVRELLSYKSEVTKAYGNNYGGYKIYLINRKGEFPTGLVPRVTRHFSNLVIIDDRVRPLHSRQFERKKLNLGSILPYPQQGRAAVECIAKDRGTVSMATGFGKSLTMALLINGLSLRTLIVVPNLSLKHQLTASMDAWFGTRAKNITIENIDSTKLKKLKDFDCLIIDEAHHVAAKTYQMLNKEMWNGIYYRFFFTATPYRSKEEEQILFESIAGKVIYEVDYKRAKDLGAIVPVTAYYYELPKTPCNARTWAEVYKKLIVQNENRNRLISSLLRQLNSADKSALCLVKQIEHGQALSDYTGFAFANGEDDNTRELVAKFNSTAYRSLIGTIGVLGEGVDTKPAEYVILAGLGKAKGQFMQMVGRGVRKHPGKVSCKIILFKDKSHKFTLNHFNSQVRYLREEYGIEPIKIGDYT